MRHIFIMISCMMKAIQLVGLGGCSSKQTVASNISESESKRTMELPRQKTAMAVAAEE